MKDNITEQDAEASLESMGEAAKRDLFEPFEPFDIEKVKQWQCPEGTGIPLITMPNVPRPLHGKGMQPRTIFGKSTWDFMRKSAYYNAGYKCEICGREPEKGDLHAHELFSYNYDKQTGKFERVVAICRTCHDGIHSGRLITMFKNKNPLYPKSYVLRVVEYDIKFYEEDVPKHKRWKGWKVIVGKNTYNSPYKSQGDWQEAMKEASAKDNMRNVPDPFSGGVFDEIDKIVDNNTQA